MTTVALVCAKQSPGTTTTALGLALQLHSTSSALFVEFDPDGGDLAARCQLHQDGPGLLSLAAASRHGMHDVDLDTHTQLFGRARLPIIAAPSSSERTTTAITTLTNQIPAHIQGANTHTVIDAGRLRSDAPTIDLLRCVDRVFVVTRPNLAEIDAVISRKQVLDSLARPAEVILIGNKPYSADDIAPHVGLNIAAVLDFDGRAASLMYENPGSFFYRKSALARSLESLAAKVTPTAANGEVIAS